MDLHPLKSSHLQGWHYDEASRTLTIGFKDGIRYTYAKVPKRAAEGLGKAKSPGGYLFAHLSKYKGKRVKDT